MRLKNSNTACVGDASSDDGDAQLAADRDWGDPGQGDDMDDALNRTINPLSIGGLTGLASDLLRHGDDWFLPRPVTVTVSEQGQRIGLQFESAVTSYDALWQWADEFGTTVEISRATRKGRKLASLTFSYYGAAIEAYAYI